MIKKLRVKFVLITMSFATAVLLGVVFGIGSFLIREIQKENMMTLQFTLRRPHTQAPQGLEVGGEVPEGFQRDPFFVMAIGTDGKAQLVYSDRMDVDDAKLAEIAAAITAAEKPAGDLRQYNLRYATDSTENGTIAALMDTNGEAKMVRSILLTTGLIGLGALGVFFAASLLLSHWALKPVERSWEQQRRFVSDASHELKTPLTVILANTGILRAHPNDTLKTQMNWVVNTEEEALRMKGLVDDLLFLSKSDDAGIKLEWSEVNLSDTADRTALRFESKAYEQGVFLQTRIEPGVRLRSDQAQLEQLTAILLDNAIKYADTGSTVTLQVSAQAGAARLSVHNVGILVGEKERARLFDRFYRADDSRSAEGYGLGLSIAKTIVDAHKGKIYVDSDEKKGTCFSVALPMHRKD